MAKSRRNKLHLPLPPSSVSPQHQPDKAVLVNIGWSGPLPHPEALSQFNDIVPNGAERIFRMAEEQQASRIHIESTGLHAAIAEAKRGQLLGASISIVALACATGSIYLGAHWSVSAMLIGVPIMSLTKAIVDSRSQNKKE